jgi:DNA-directed RNA polymerase specialized sigma54-like protein
LLSVSETLDASSPVLKQYQKLFQTFPTETQQPVMKIIQILDNSGFTKTDLQQAAIQYGLPMDMSHVIESENDTIHFAPNCCH